MKVLLGLFLFFTAQFSEAYVSGEFFKGGDYSITIKLPSEDKFAIALKDALIQSSELKEIIHEYSPPGTRWSGNGVTVQVMSYGSTEFEFRGLLSQGYKVLMDGEIVQFSGKGVASALYEALRASTSSHVQKQGTPNESNRGHGVRFFVQDLSGKNNHKMMLSCSPYYDDNSQVLCSLYK